ncbi:MAG: FAD-dependent oxidoreductase [Pseudomonadota bacterium]|nr:MAG: FAD-dependent oxidoreductase [Pseudomonadota bacterium]
MKIAIIGTGISGNVVARRLHERHDITVFEANDYVGGHTHTHDIEHDDRHYALDTGFIVFNERTYPNFVQLLDEIGAESQPSEMSFSVKCERTGLEYNGQNLNTLFAQRRNLLNPGFFRMLRDILRFNREAPKLLARDHDHLTLGEFLARGRYCSQFIEQYVIPMGAAIWSSAPEQMHRFPARYFMQFFHNHGLLSVNNRPQWRVIKGGSRAYVERLVAPFRDRIRTATPVEMVRRCNGYVEITARGGLPERFDQVFIACHSDQALRMLADASAREREVLGAIPYQANEAVLHTDSSLLPRRRLAWAAWNYHVLPEQRGRVAVTYDMNILQGLKAPATFCVTLNNTDAIDPRHLIKRISYHHPVFTPKGVAAQQRHGEVSGVNRTYYCGAYWRYGFHEDGVVSALAALQQFEENNAHEQLHLRRAS